MVARKISSLVVMSIFLSGSILPGYSHASMDFWMHWAQLVSERYMQPSSSKKVRQFLSWENKVLTYMHKDYNSVAIQLKNANAKKGYVNEYAGIVTRIKKVFSDAKYSSDYMIPEHLSHLKKEIETYKTLRTELATLSGSTVNPFSLPVDEIASVENDMVDLQKIVTSSIRKVIDSYDTSDIKETGKMSLHSEGGFGKVDISIEKYTKLLSILTLSQEVEVVGNATFTINSPESFTYNETTGGYEKTKGRTISGDMSVDGSVKVINTDVYLTLKDYTIHTNLTGKEKDSFEKSLKEWGQYKGKTVKIPLSSPMTKTNSINQAEMLSQFKKALDILETKSLLTPSKKIGEIYTMTIKDETVTAIGSIYNQKIEKKDMDQAKQEIQAYPLLYSVTNGKKTLFSRINESNAAGMVSLTKQDNAYAFLLDTKNPKNPADTVHVLVKKDFVEGKIRLFGVKANLDYANQSLLFTAEAFMQNLSIKWPLSKEITDLIFTFNGQKMGSIAWKKVADTYTYDILYEATIMEVLSKFHLNGETTMTRGAFPITVPQDAVKIDPYGAGVWEWIVSWLFY